MMYKKNLIAVVKCNGKILREKGSTVYLPFGSEYSILLKNEEARKAVVSIEVDGVDVLNNNKLILNGGTSQEIKGFMKNMKETNKFRFINKTKEIQDYRGDKIEDGSIRISYQFEAIVEEPVIIFPTWVTSNNIYYNNCTYPTYTRDKLVGSSISANYCCTKGFSSLPSSDEGITVKGKQIDVDYTYGAIGMLENNTHVIVLLLKGKTPNKYINKPITVNTTLLCSTCGRKNRSNNNFCRNCGTCLN